MTDILIDIFVPVISVLLLGGVTYLIRIISNWIKSKNLTENQNRIMQSIIMILNDKVKEALQTQVDALKKEGKFDLEAQDKILSEVIREIINTLTDEMRLLLDNKYQGGLYNTIKSKVEAILFEIKNNMRR